MAQDSKTEKATPKKRREERKKGNIAKSTDVVNFVLLFGAFYALKLILPAIYETVGSFLKRYIELSGGVTEATVENAGKYGMEFLTACAKTILPFAFVCMLLGILAHGVQSRFLFSSKKIAFKLSNLSPLKGIKNLFSAKNVVELLKNVLKVTILIVMLYQVLVKDAVNTMRMMDMDVMAATLYIFDMIMGMLGRLAIAFLALAGLDFFYQRWSYERGLRMTKQETKEEFKQMEGDPKIKGKIRDIQRQRAMSRMMQAVPSADVIIRNPTHYAVALSYDMDNHNAPIVVAKGQDELALRIVKVGQENHVTVIENKPLARGLYAGAELNREIPTEYYGAVAEILVYVYKMNKKME